MEHESDVYTNCNCVLGTVPKRFLKTLKLEEKWEPFNLQRYWDRPEYWEDSLRLEETCYQSESSERPSANADVKNSQGVITIKENLPYHGFYLPADQRKQTDR